ncbi:hypothetical protein T484DRAFT_1780469 [Baffinella frigidus]|nr:hypothetical protein T484DRAFT_1780469 [Cryptophyta sp. CCMP2293]
MAQSRRRARWGSGAGDSGAQRAGAEAVAVANGVLAQMEVLLAETGRDKSQAREEGRGGRYEEEGVSVARSREEALDLSAAGAPGFPIDVSQVRKALSGPDGAKKAALLQAIRWRLSRCSTIRSSSQKITS